MHNHKYLQPFLACGLVLTGLMWHSNAVAQSTISKLLEANSDNETAIQTSLISDGRDLIQAVEQNKIHSLHAYQQQLAGYILSPRDRFELSANSNYFFNENSDFLHHHIHGSYTFDGHKFGLVVLQGQSNRNNLRTPGTVEANFIGLSGQYGYQLQENFGMNIVASNLRHHVTVPRYVSILGNNYLNQSKLDFNEVLVGSNGFIHYNVDKHFITSNFGLNYSQMILAPFQENFGDVTASFPSQQLNNLNLLMDFNYKYDGLFNIEKLGVEVDYSYNSPISRWGEIKSTLSDGTQSANQSYVTTLPEGLHFYTAKLNYKFTPDVKLEMGAGLIYQRNLYYTVTGRLLVNF